MTNSTLNVAKVSNRGNKYAIVSGSAILQKFKTIEAAKNSLAEKRSFWLYWAESVSISVDNSNKIEIIC